jgi:hypothetical protein
MAIQVYSPLKNPCFCWLPSSNQNMAMGNPLKMEALIGKSSIYIHIYIQYIYIWGLLITIPMWIGYIQICIFRSFTQSCLSSYLPRKWGGKKLIHALAMCIFLWFPSLNPSDSLALQEWSKDAVAKRCGDLSISHQMSPKPLGK